MGYRSSQYRRIYNYNRNAAPLDEDGIHGKVYTVPTEGIVTMEMSLPVSGDYEIAIEEGATMIRVGSKIFGERNY